MTKIRIYYDANNLHNECEILNKGGDILEFTIESPSENPNAYMGDIKMSSEFQEEENYLASNGPNTYQFAAIKTGTYYIIVSGNKLKGKLKVDWNIK
ncbi:hypothetical protein COJ48_14000 [Bacillus cereus]|nr:hypothetical protein COJ48_14000 [Bacillus cereus]PGP74987.1 hypothetical protein CN997_26860 [Bacillus cereus]